ncbi:hypothetical protein LTS18_010373, partial [Coniosporium uncinatum]
MTDFHSGRVVKDLHGNCANGVARLQQRELNELEEIEALDNLLADEFMNELGRLTMLK